MSGVTNNINSAWIQYKFGKAYANATRLEKGIDVPKAGVSGVAGGRYGALFENSLVQKKHIQAQGDVFVMLLPFWQLELYYQVAGASKNLPSMDDRLSGIPAPAGQPDVAYWYGDVLEKMRTTSQAGIDNGRLSLNFVGAVCDAVQEDLTDFFVKSGYLLPIDRDIDDYGVQHMTVTQAQIDSLIAAVNARGYPKPVSPVLNYISVNSLGAYKNRIPLVGAPTVGVTINSSTLTIDNTKWANAVVFETYNQKTLTDVSIYGTGDATAANSKTTVQFGAGATSVYAVGYDGKKILVYPENDPVDALPVRLVSFTAQNLENKQVRLHWQVADEENFSRYEIERATSPGLFRTIGFLDGNGQSAYTFTDESPLRGTGYYRLKMVDLDDTFAYSPIKAVQVSPKANFVVNSNPAKNGVLNFRVEGLDAATPLTFSVTTASGQLLKTEHFDKVRTNLVYTTRLGHAGVYIVQVYLATGEKFATKIVVAE